MLKKETGSRSWTSDLSRSLSLEEQQTKVMEFEADGHDRSGTLNTAESSAFAAGFRRVDLGLGPQGQFMPQEWDDAFGVLGLGDFRCGI